MSDGPNDQKTRCGKGMTGGRAHQQGWGVDVDGLDNRELLLDLPDCAPGAVKLGFHPVANATVLPFERSHQGPVGDRRINVSGMFQSNAGMDISYKESR